MGASRAVRFLRVVYRDNRLRLPEQRRSLARDLGLYAKNVALRPAELRLLRRYRGGGEPMVFIVGLPRSGTTLLYQLLARHSAVEYINNTVARYWLAPLWALRRWRARPGGEELEGSPLRSRLGGTEGADEPHEFSWFWQYWMGPGASDHLTDEELDGANFGAIRRELEAIVTWAGRPLVSKCITFVDYQIARFARELPAAKFLWIRRDPRFVAQSILESRRARYGDEAVWWSLRPRDIANWLARDPLEQVCHQVRDGTAAIEGGIASLPAGRSLLVDYEELVAAPAEALARVGAWVPAPLRRRDDLETLRLVSGNRLRLEQARFATLERLLGSPVVA